jgi:hypothetical protein
LTTATFQHLIEVDPGFPNKLGLLVIVEERKFEVVVIGRFMYNEPKFLIPGVIV